MAKLFRKEYHELSRFWYFLDSINYKKEDIEVKLFINEKDNYLLKFFPKNNLINYFEIEIEYDLKQVVHSNCSTCKDKECKHYYSMIKYGYFNIEESLLTTEKPTFLHKKQLLITSKFYCLTEINGKIIIYGLYDKENKVRISFEQFKDFPIFEIAKSLVLKENNRYDQFIALLSEGDILLLKFLHKNMCSKGKNRLSFTIYQKFLPKLFPILKSLNRDIILKESGKKLVFSNQSEDIIFHITQRDNRSYHLFIEFKDGKSVIFTGNTIFVLSENKLFSFKIPLKETNLLVKNKVILTEHDLVLFVIVAIPYLETQGIKVKIHTKIPKFIISQPRVKFFISQKNDKFFIKGILLFEEKYEIPFKMVNQTSQLLKFMGYWIFIPFKLKKSLENFISRVKYNYAKDLIFNISDIELIARKIYYLSNSSWEFQIDESIKNYFIQKKDFLPQIKAKRFANINWFEIDVKYRIKGLTISHQEFKQFINSKDEFITLSDNSRVKPSSKSINSFYKIDKYSSSSLKHKKTILPLSFLPYMRNFIQPTKDLNIMIDDIISRRLKKYTKIPLENILRDYQKAGFMWIKMLQEYGLSGILADDMGVGKSIQALAAITQVKGINLIICPKTLIFNWENEINKFVPNLSYHLFEKKDLLQKNSFKDFNIVIVSYSSLSINIDFFEKIDFSYIILDEAQYIKNSRSLRSTNIKRLKSHYRLSLTGTPIENSINDITSQFDFLMPQFLSSFLNKKEENLLKTVKALVSPFILRRTKAEVLNQLPSKTEHIIPVPMESEQEKIYKTTLAEIQNNLDKQFFSKEKINYINILSYITRLRQITNHPRLINESYQNIPSGKLNVLMEVLNKALKNGKKIIIFSQFVKMLKIIEELIKQQQINYLFMDGKSRKRKQLISEFNSNREVRLFLMSLKVGGVGINLTSADTIIMTDPWWNPMTEEQAIGRIHRIGQQKKSFVYRLITKQSIEEKIKTLQKSKSNLYNALIENNSSYVKNISYKKVKNLFSI